MRGVGVGGWEIKPTHLPVIILLDDFTVLTRVGGSEEPPSSVLNNLSWEFLIVGRMNCLSLGRNLPATSATLLDLIDSKKLLPPLLRHLPKGR